MDKMPKNRGLQVATQKTAGKLKITISEHPEVKRIKEIRAKQSPTNKDIAELVGILIDRLVASL